MKLDWMSIAIFIAIAYGAFWVGGMVLDFLIPLAPSLFTGIVGEAIRFALPVAVFYVALRFMGKTK